MRVVLVGWSKLQAKTLMKWDEPDSWGSVDNLVHQALYLLSPHMDDSLPPHLGGSTSPLCGGGCLNTGHVSGEDSNAQFIYYVMMPR